MNRRSVLAGVLAATSLALLSRPSSANTLPKLAVYRNPGCGCCEGWMQHMRTAGFEVTIEDDPDLDARRASLGISAELASCHIALTDGYAFEGHIPAADVVKFLHDRPAAAVGIDQILPVHTRGRRGHAAGRGDAGHARREERHRYADVAARAVVVAARPRGVVEVDEEKAVSEAGTRVPH